MVMVEKYVMVDDVLVIGDDYSICDSRNGWYAVKYVVCS